ncbi:hypothetical protein GMOD_00005307 [Pyrenophora seminiperda CCB06]|uniref:Uncharacterized protein n=1 Tax=Pyrenophora seminiperda CCB06 TaxID=1302712 RepID=A0A3M7LVH7_9PLEO|nr:hypothetical protein GMOD_00005307 [Pyrenophora seminiperda CCB06]
MVTPSFHITPIIVLVRNLQPKRWLIPQNKRPLIMPPHTLLTKFPIKMPQQPCQNRSNRQFLGPT